MNSRIARLLALLALGLSSLLAAGYNLKPIDEQLSKIAQHAQNFPPSFASPAERREYEGLLRQQFLELDHLAFQNPKDLEILFRIGMANAMGHNLDFKGCAEKAVAAYKQILALRPDDRRANYYLGAFLSSTAKQKDSIPYLTKAISLGVVDAHYTIAIVYIGQNDRPKAAAHLREYTKMHPNDANLKKLIAELEKEPAAKSGKTAKPNSK